MNYKKLQRFVFWCSIISFFVYNSYHLYRLLITNEYEYVFYGLESVVLNLVVLLLGMSFVRMEKTYYHKYNKLFIDEIDHLPIGKYFLISCADMYIPLMVISIVVHTPINFGYISLELFLSLMYAFVLSVSKYFLQIIKEQKHFI